MRIYSLNYRLICIKVNIALLCLLKHSDVAFFLGRMMEKTAPTIILIRHAQALHSQYITLI